jgi:septum formation protein
VKEAADSPRAAIVLGSRSPQRKALLELIVPPGDIVIRPPTSHEEPGFDDVHDWPGIELRLREIATLKLENVMQQHAATATASKDDLVLCADTVIVGSDAAGRLAVLGQPPQADTWRETVRSWFQLYYRNKKHWAATAVCVSSLSGRRLVCIVNTAVTFGTFDDASLDWYLSTGESQNKAGGYALQGAASIFVERIEGSPSNVIGLPLRETRELLIAAGWRCEPVSRT